MTRLLAAASMATLLAACTASSDDVSVAGENDVAALVAGDTSCPRDLWLDLEQYPTETLPVLADEDFANWHEENGQREGVQTSTSGLQYKIIQAGIENGVVPVPGEGMTAHYHGYFPSGEVFDSSLARDQPMTHISDGFIAGWNEAIADMKVCEARTLYVPGVLAYDTSTRPGVPKGSLVFHMQLLDVDRE